MRGGAFSDREQNVTHAVHHLVYNRFSPLGFKYACIGHFRVLNYNMLANKIAL